MTTSTATVPATLTSPRMRIVNSAIAFVLAAMVNDSVHEMAHAATCLVLGITPTLGPYAVSYDDTGVSVRHKVITALAGPVFSLVLGLVLMVVARRWGRGIVRLFWMWLAFMGVMNFVGYLFISFFGGGDTGLALNLLHAPGWVFIATSLVGVGGLFLLGRRFAVELKRYTVDQDQERQLAYFPWLLGTPVILLLALAEGLVSGAGLFEALLITAYGIAVGVFAPTQFTFRDKVHNTWEALDLDRVSPVGPVLMAVGAVALVTLAATGGITLG